VLRTQFSPEDGAYLPSVVHEDASGARTPMTFAGSCGPPLPTEPASLRACPLARRYEGTFDGVNGWIDPTHSTRNPPHGGAAATGRSATSTKTKV